MKKTVTGLLTGLSWQPDLFEDLGDITTARATEAMILAVSHILRCSHPPCPAPRREEVTQDDHRAAG
ncbi:hypothetical protein [Streptomyces sp. NPDC020571]|uniref:hypothetical protein n=1 Tax=Streptomyces sp. NPDC020571 TaxID=3365079 RepID=UPI00378AC361